MKRVETFRVAFLSSVAGQMKPVNCLLPNVYSFQHKALGVKAQPQTLVTSISLLYHLKFESI